MVTLRRGVFLVCVASWLPACLQPHFPEPTAYVVCESDSECLPGWFCAPGPQRCANATSDLDPPTIIDATIDPPLAGILTAVEITLFVNEPLSHLLVTFGLARERFFEPVSSSYDDLEDRWVYQLETTVIASDLGGSALVAADIWDAFGNPNQAIILGSFVIDVERPEIDSGFFDRDTVARGGTVTVSITATEELAEPPKVEIKLPTPEPFTPVSVSGTTHTLAWTATSTTPTGAFEVEVTLVDLAGNQSYWSVGSITVTQ